MARSKSEYRCVECGTPFFKGEVRCNRCGGEVEEERPEVSPRGQERFFLSERPVISLGDAPEEEFRRWPTGQSEFDRVLGGGLAETQVVLLAGRGGMGKTTLMHQVLGTLSDSAGLRVLYASGEEAASLARARAGRLGPATLRIPFLATTSIARVLKEARERDVQLLFIDSLHVMGDEEVAGLPGNPKQTQAVTSQVVRFAKETGAAVVMNAHATGQDEINAIQRILHLVDTPMVFERLENFRVLRAKKNRFGPDDEIGYFEMHHRGMVSIENPSSAFLGPERGPQVGAVLSGFGEGNRPVLLEVQALAAQTIYPSPQRVSVGYPPKKLAAMLAVLERHAGVSFVNQDVFVSLAGGLTVSEPILDSAILAALVSSIWDRPVDRDLLVLGEVGLDGGARPVRSGERIIAEANRLGFTRFLVPAHTRLEDLPERVRGVVEYPDVQSLLGHVVGARPERRPGARRDGPRQIPSQVRSANQVKA